MSAGSSIQRASFTTGDPESGVQALRDLYYDHELRLAGSGRGFRMGIAAVGCDRLAIGKVGWPLPAESSSEEPRPLVATQVRRGTATVRGGRAVLSLRCGEWAARGTAGRERVAWEPEPVAGAPEVLVRTVRLDAGRAASVIGGLAATTGSAQDRARSARTDPRGDVRMELTAPIDAQHARYWNDTVDFVEHDVLCSEDLMNQPLIRHNAFESLVRAMLVSFPNPVLDELLDPDTTAAEPGTAALLRRALAYIDQYAGDPIGEADIAAAAGVDPPGLRRLFRRLRDTTPAAYLRQVRLDGAHRDLLAGDPTRDTVEAIAARWGFASPRAFLTGYHRIYRCHPGATLRRWTRSG